MRPTLTLGENMDINPAMVGMITLGSHCRYYSFSYILFVIVGEKILEIDRPPTQSNHYSDRCTVEGKPFIYRDFLKPIDDENEKQAVVLSLVASYYVGDGKGTGYMTLQMEY